MDGEEKELRSEEEVNGFRRQLKIRVKGTKIPPPLASFSLMRFHLSIRSILLKNIETSKWKEPTPVQMQAIPCLLSLRDVVAAAPTGSGTVYYTILYYTPLYPSIAAYSAYSVFLVSFHTQ